MKGYSWQNNRKKLLAIRNRYVFEQDLIHKDLGFDPDHGWGGEWTYVENEYEDGTRIITDVARNFSSVLVLPPEGGKIYLYKEEL